MKLVSVLLDKSALSLRIEDPDWFQDVSTNAKTKEEFLFKNCQSRIRGYLSRAESQIGELKLNKSEKSEVDSSINKFKQLLKENKFHGTYFDRSSGGIEKICDKR